MFQRIRQELSSRGTFGRASAPSSQTRGFKVPQPEDPSTDSNPQIRHSSSIGQLPGDFSSKAVDEISSRHRRSESINSGPVSFQSAQHTCPSTNTTNPTPIAEIESEPQLLSEQYSGHSQLDASGISNEGIVPSIASTSLSFRPKGNVSYEDKLDQQPLDTQRRPEPPPSVCDDEDWRSALPQHIECVLTVLLDDNIAPEIQFNLSWLRTRTPDETPVEELATMQYGIWEQLVAQARLCLSRLDKRPQISGTDYNLRSGICNLVGTRNSTDKLSLCIEDHVDESLVIPICRFIGNHPFEKFCIRIRWNYATSQAKAELKANEIKNMIVHRAKRNFENKRYFPRLDVDEMISREVALAIVSDCKDLNLEQKKFLNEKVYPDRIRLLAVCVVYNLSLKLLHDLIYHNEEVKDVWKPSFEKTPLRDDSLKGDWSHFVENLPQFFANQFGKDGAPFLSNMFDERIENDDNEESEFADIKMSTKCIVPISYSKEKGDKIGEGGFSTVYAVQIHPQYHNFSVDKDEVFALKRWTTTTYSEERFRKEAKVLKTIKRYLKDPHQHMVAPLTAWSQGENFYMLFELADFDLSVFMNHSRSTNTKQMPWHATENVMRMEVDRNTGLPVLNRKFLDWLFSQFYGLCDALKYLHHLDLEGNSDRKCESSHRTVASHMDVKPENILVYFGRGHEYGTLKLTDFGSATIVNKPKGTNLYTATRTGNSARLKNITPTYESPDQHLGTRRWSRKGDIWSLGCVFLQMLIWCLEPGEDKQNAFAKQRLEEAGSKHRFPFDRTCDTFWTATYVKLSAGQCGDNAERIKYKTTISLKPCVKKKIQSLQDMYCRDESGQLCKMVVAVKWMLAIQSLQRWSARRCVDEISIMLKNVSIHYRGPEDKKSETPPIHVSRASDYAGAVDDNGRELDAPAESADLPPVTIESSEKDVVHSGGGAMLQMPVSFHNGQPGAYPETLDTSPARRPNSPGVRFKDEI